MAIKPTKSVFHEEETIDPADHFYFESDHLALKGNKDYRDLLKIIVTLNAQRTQAIKDLDTLLLAKKQALEDPIAYYKVAIYQNILGCKKLQKSQKLIGLSTILLSKIIV